MKEDCLIFTDTQNVVVVIPYDSVRKIQFVPRTGGERTGYIVRIQYDFDETDENHCITEEEFEQLQMHSRY